MVLLKTASASISENSLDSSSQLSLLFSLDKIMWHNSPDPVTFCKHANPSKSNITLRQ